MIKKFKKNIEGRDFIGKEYSTNEGDIAVIVEYQNYENVYVTFKSGNTPTGFTIKCQLGDLRRGRVKNPYKRQHSGVGYKGVGPYLMAVNGKNTKAFDTWSSMLKRCYIDTNPSYVSYGMLGVYVSDDWQNFQVFAEWYTQKYKEGFEIDKDLIKKGNLEYGIDFCRLIPKEVNKFVKSDGPSTGVWFNGLNYVAQISQNRGNKILGRFPTLGAARTKFIEAKAQKAKCLAEKYLQDLPEDCYNSLINYWSRYE